jgi:hypothetical protein
VATQLNVGDDAGLNAVACTSPGNCVAVGSAETSGKDSGALVVEEIGGRWNAGKIVAPTLRRGGVAFLESVSCASFGNCTAVGATTSSNDVPHPLVVTELGGEWGSGKELPVSLGIGDSTLSTVMCPAPSDCAAAGSYVDVHSGTQAFVDSMSNGVWSAAKPVGQAFTTSSHEANLTSVSCNAVGDCVAVGYSNRFTASVTVVRASPLAVVEVKGVWGKGVEVAKALNSGGQGELDSVSCPKRVTCTAVGMYTLRDGHAHPLGVTEVNGSWGAPLLVAGTIPASYQAFNNYGDTLFDSEGDLDSISCPAPRNCEALFSYMSNQGIQVAVASRLLGGEWTQSSIVGQNLVPARVDNARGAPYVVPFAVSCSAPDECSAVGNYGWSGVKGQAFAVNLR